MLAGRYNQQYVTTMPANSQEDGSRHSRSHSRYSKAATPLPPIPVSRNGNGPMSIVHHPSHPAQMRTPVAWHVRDANLSRPVSALPYPVMNAAVHRYQANSVAHQAPAARPSSPSATTTSSDDREEVPMVRVPRRPNR